MRSSRTKNRWQSFGVPLLVFIQNLEPCAWAKPATKPQNSLQSVYEVRTNNPSGVPYNDYHALRAWIATHDFYGFPKEFQLDLNGDGKPEMFLPVVAHAHFASYSIFTKHRKRWAYLGSGDYSDPPIRLGHNHAGWHDFAVDVEGSRNSLDRRYFQYDPKDRSYAFSYSVSRRPMERDASDSAAPPAGGARLAAR